MLLAAGQYRPAASAHYDREQRDRRAAVAGLRQLPARLDAQLLAGSAVRHLRPRTEQPGAEPSAKAAPVSVFELSRSVVDNWKTGRGNRDVRSALDNRSVGGYVESGVGDRSRYYFFPRD